jgi:hypothetical protein
MFENSFPQSRASEHVAFFYSEENKNFFLILSTGNALFVWPEKDLQQLSPADIIVFSIDGCIVKLDKSILAQSFIVLGDKRYQLFKDLLLHLRHNR